MPVLGLGVAELSDDETERAVSAALEIGYRLIDTAAVYGNEAAVGRAIAASGHSPRRVVRHHQGGQRRPGIQHRPGRRARSAWTSSAWTTSTSIWCTGRCRRMGKYVDSFGGLIQARGDGSVRSIGVCNFTEEHLETVIDLSFVTPAVNQIELHPLLNQAELRAVNAQHNVVTEAYSPLAVGRLLDNPTVTSIAGEYGRTPAQVLIRWSIQLGNVVIPRSANPERIAEQFRRLRFRVDRRAHGSAQRRSTTAPGCARTR